MSDKKITITVSTTTHKLLKRLAERGLHGIGISGVVEGFAYRGLQAAESEGWLEPDRIVSESK